MITKNPLINNDDLSVLDRIEQENNLTEIQVQRGTMSYIPVLISLMITLFGLYGFADTLIKNEIYLYGVLGVLASIILLMEHNRTNLFGDWFGSLLEENINKDVKKPIIGFIIAILVTGVFIALDVFGAISMSTYVQKNMIENTVVESKAYQLAEANAKSGAETTKIYLSMLKDWRADKKEAFNSCDKSYPISKSPKGNNWCKDEWSKKNKKPKSDNIKTNSSVDLNIFKELESDAKVSLNGYEDYFFYAFLVLSMLLNYLAVASILNQYRSKDKHLTSDMIEVLRDRFESIENEKLLKMRNSNDVIESKLRESFELDVGIEEATYNINTDRKREVLNHRRELANGVNNKEYREQYPKNKAGKIDLKPHDRYNDRKTHDRYKTQFDN